MSEKTQGVILYSKKLSKVFYLILLFLKFESHDFSYLDMKYSPHHFLISNNLFVRLKNIYIDILF